MLRVRKLRKLFIDPSMLRDHMFAERADLRRTAFGGSQLTEIDLSGADAGRRQHELLIGWRDLRAGLHQTTPRRRQHGGAKEPRKQPASRRLTAVAVRVV